MISAFVFAALVFCAALSGAMFKPGPWYESLNKPGWTPPNWAFPVVWTVLYIFIAVSGWLVWQAGGLGPAMALWAFQLVLNAMWSWLFFGLRRMDLALACVLAMLVAILAFIVLAWSADRLAALLFVPYLVWVSIAANLNRTVMRLNPDAGTTS